MNCECTSCPLLRRRRCTRRRRGRMNKQLLLPLLSTVLLILLATVGKTSGFLGIQQKDNNDEHSQVYHHGRGGGGGGAFLRSSLQSFAEQGASKWGDYVSTATKSKALTRSSALYISQLHETIQRMRSSSDGRSNTGNKNYHLGEKAGDPRDEDETTSTTAPSEHFAQEIIAAILGGATAGSAFAAATAGAFAATAIMALGAIATVFFSDEMEEISPPIEEAFGNLDVRSGVDQIIKEAGCDYNGEDRDDEHDVENFIRPSTALKPPLSQNKLPEFLLEELMRCYNGNPYFAATLFPLHDYRDVCIVDTHSIMSTDKELLMVEPSTIMSENLSPMEPAVPKRVEVVWHDSRLGLPSDDTISSNLPTKPKRPRQILQHFAAERPRFTEDTPSISLTDAERDGALLLAESLRVASSAVGLLASGVRFAGETAAATAGGTARLTGGVIRLSGWAVGSLGEAIQNSGSGRDIDAKEELAISSARSDLKTNNKRIVAGTSVRLLGDAIEQIADSLLLAGSATEHVAFAATGAAEGALRIMENSLTKISDIFSREGQRGTSTMSSSVELESNADIDESGLDLDEIATFEVSRYTPEEAISSSQMDGEILRNEMQKSFQNFSSWVVHHADLIVADTLGVPSLSREILSVFLLCFIASLLLLRSRHSTQKEKPSRRLVAGDAGGMQCTISFGNRHESTTNHHVAEDDSHTTLTAESTTRGPYFDHGNEEPMTSGVKKVLYTLLVPLMLARSIITLAWSVFVRKEIALLVFYLLGWIYLSRSAQYKSSVIQRKSELFGFQMAIMSIDKVSPSIESAVWLNSLIHRTWRVKSGGLEPMISTYLSSILAERFSQPYSKSSGVAHVALDAFTLGSSPPMISRIELIGVDEKDDSTTLLKIDVGMLFHDAVLLLDIKPSSLEYKSLPSSKISVNSLDAKATFNLAVKITPDYPFISYLDISLADIPDFNLKIEPQSESGLKGVDLGSIPILSSWIKSSISSSLAYYLSPQHISIDILAWLRGHETVATYFES